MLSNQPESSESSSIDLTNCDRELIHLARAIQPHGALLVVDEGSFIIRQASANTHIHLGLPYPRLIGLSLQCLLQPGDWLLLQERLQNRNFDEARLYLMVIEGLPGVETRIHLFAHRSDGRLLLEFEPAGSCFTTAEIDHLSTLSNTLRALRDAPSLSGFLDIGLRWLSGFTGFDRVMAYRFNTDGSGQVIAESIKNGLEPFLGLHYPASDIPAPARRLFGYSLLRHLPDTDYTPVPLMVAERQESTVQLDMSYLFLRSVSTMYTGYLRNMGVRSALVMPLVTRNNEIWGVISCLHHAEPRYLSYERRVPIKYLGQSLSLMIHDRRELEHYEYQVRLDVVLDGLIRNLSQSGDLHATLCADTPHLLSALNADGVVLFYDGRLGRIGNTPDLDTLENITRWLAQKDSAITATHRLWQDAPELTRQGNSCGLLSVRLSKSRSDWIIWFREETPRDIDWAGNPEKPVEINRDQHETRLLPRTSFARWRQTVKGESAIWQDCEIDYAVRLRQAIFGIIVERTRQLEQVNAELRVSMAKNQRMLEELNRYSQRLALAQHRAHLGYWDWHIDTGHFEASDALCHLYGRLPGTLTGSLDTLTAHVSPDDLNRLRNHFESCQCHETFRIDMQITRTDGELRILDTLGEIICDENGHPLRVSGSSQDVTERKQIEKQIEKLALAVEQSPESIMITNLDGRIEYVNRAFTRHSGYSADEAIGQSPRLLNSGLTSPDTYQALWRTIRQGQVWEGEFVNRRKDGGLFVQRAKITPLRQPDGQVTHYIALQEDISEQKRMAEELEAYRNELEQRVDARTRELRRQSRFLRALIDHLPHQAWLKDVEGRILTANRALAQSYGLLPSALEGLRDVDLLSPQKAAAYQNDENNVMHTGMPLIREASLDQIPDSLYETYLAPVFDDENQILGTVGFARDIKPQRQLESELALRVREAETAIRAKSAFLANMSHEIRTPLTAIIGFGESLLETSQTPEERNQAIQTILRNGRHLQELIANILDFSRIEAEEHPIEPGKIALLPLLSEVHALAVSLAQGHQLHFSTHLMPPLPETIRSDATWIRQILINLIGNAVKFTSPPGTVRLIVSLDRDAEQLVITIQDTGIGIDQADTGHLFKPFSQADASITRRFGGTGLGLSISRELARRLKGDIRVFSLKNLGSSFVITLATGPLDPVTLIEEAAGLSIQTDTLDLQQTLPCLQGRVLLAEDTPDNQQLISLLIGRAGAQAIIAQNGEEALEIAQSAEFDLVLMDMQMPVMGGLEASELLRMTGFSQPIIMLTANASDSDKADAEQAGCNGFLTKPIDQQAFFSTLEQYLPKRRSEPVDDRVRNSLENDAEYIALRAAFFEELPIRRQGLEAAFTRGDRETLAKRLHQLKGIAGSFGFPDISEAARLMEAALKNGDQREITRQGQKLFQLIRQAE